MSKLISTQSRLIAFLPNTMETVEGETTLYDKTASHLEAAESLLIHELTGDIVDDIAAGQYGDETLHAATAAVACLALAAAVPSLDLILTPNGFGIVSTTNIAPASRERVASLTASLEKDADAAILRLYRALCSQERWRTSERGRYFGASMINSLGSRIYSKVIDETRLLERYRQCRQILTPFEDRIACDYISPELYARLTAESLQSDGEGCRIYSRIRAVLVLMAEGMDCHDIMSGIVDEIRRSPELYPEWQRSRQRLLFEPPVFENKKSSGGYFF